MERIINFYTLISLFFGVFLLIYCISPQPTDLKSKEVSHSTFIEGDTFHKTDFEKFYFEFIQAYLADDTNLIIQYISDSLLTRGGLDIYPEVVYLTTEERLVALNMFFEQQLGLPLSDSSFKSKLKSYFGKCQNEYEQLKYKNGSEAFQRRCDMQFVNKASKWYISFLYLDDKTIRDLDNVFHRGGLPEGWDDK